MDVIRSTREIDSIFRGARRLSDSQLIVLLAQTPEGRGRTGRVAFIAGKKLGGAVLRNRSKRVLRESARLAGGPWPGWDVVLMARRSTAGSHPVQVAESLALLLERAGVL